MKNAENLYKLCLDHVTNAYASFGSKTLTCC